MIKITRWLAQIGAAMNTGGPWGGGSDGDGTDGGDGGGGKGPRNPWNQPSSGGRPRGRGPSALDELLRRGREGFGGGMPQRPGGKQLWPILAILFVIIWIALTSVHRIGPQERGVLTRLGSYVGIMTPGISFSLPAPFDTVQIVDVEEIRTIDIPTGTGEKLVLTGDQNIVDLAYSVRWNIRSANLYKFELADPESTIREVAESAMRSVVATVSLNDTIGSGRTEIEQRVQQRMQEILDGYRSGILVQGVAIKQADPPEAVNDAFKEVSAAQQTAQTYMNEARAYAQQLTAKAQGEAAAFDKVYSEYRLAPEVTRRRMYYETMEEVLSNIDKTIVESGNVTPYLALPEIRKRAQQPTPANPAGDQ
ncbi:MAG: FtsH protease activity modulator HflK [Alphaproteobacteria bacterium]|nr:FtsH protease activity modulator HflK [Alphaproteobacteria bacterium]